MTRLQATVIVPTTGDRAALLRHAVGSILGQTVPDLEIFVMGDGVAEPSRAAIAAMVRADPRIRFFDHPKHVRRGEPYRHAALAEARGEIVCYLTDRDLMLPRHVEVMAALLRDADFGHTLRFGIEPDGSLSFVPTIDIDDPGDRRIAVESATQLIPLSFAGHTLAMYRRLPFGWRETPAGEYTDRYMWKQFLAARDCRTATSTMPTILYFNRGDHPGWPVERRLPEIAAWSARLARPDWIAGFAESVGDAAIRDRARLARAVPSPPAPIRLRTRLARRFPRLARVIRRIAGRPAGS
ncbi:MAG: glycosyltransferase family 2 protein [Bauldia sp.]|nr:glycosyltransferase family 2 protein [Bauldia sp.]